MPGEPIASRLALLPEKEAVARFFDHRNASTLRKVLFVVGQVALIATVVFLAQGAKSRAVASGTALVLVGALYLARRGPLFRDRIRPLLLGVLLLLLAALLAAAHGPQAVSFSFVAFVFPFVCAFFRLRHREYLAVGTGLLALACWLLWTGSWLAETGPRIASTVAALLTGGVALTLGAVLTRRSRRRFLADWRHAASRERERVRMRTELSDAREIQLSMLPRAAPTLDWLELSSVSLPATEVGGDYFDYLRLSETRLAVIVGDVAGHGVAAGLVLSAVRAGLYLLQDQLLRPVEVLTKLDPMIRDTAPARMFVTLQLAIVDRHLGRLTVASAGHPPILHLQGDAGRAARVGGGAPPLGTRLEKDFVEEQASLESGDFLIFHTDGLTEARNHRDELYGDERLLAEAGRLADGASARSMRDGLLSSTAHFRGDVEQEDDVTLLVTRYLG